MKGKKYKIYNYYVHFQLRIRTAESRSMLCVNKKDINYFKTKFFLFSNLTGLA